MRAEPTTLPSASAAIAFTDDVPMSIPTVTSLIGPASRPPERGEHLVVEQPVRRDRAAAVGARPALEVGEPPAGLLHDHLERQRCPRGS